MVDVLQNFSALLEKPGKLAPYVDKHLPKILAILMLLFVVTDLERILSSYDMNFFLMMEETDNMPLAFYSDVLMLFFTFSILVHRNISNSKAISIYLISLGLSRIVASIEPLLGVNDFRFYFAILMCTLSTNMLVTGVFFYRGISRNRSSVMAASLMMIVVYILLISVILRYAPEPFAVLLDNISYVFHLILYLVLLAALDSYDVFLNSNMGRVDNSVRELNGAIGATERTVLSVQEAKTIYNGFGSMVGWTKVDDETPVEYQYMTVISMGDSNSEMVLQKWKGSNKIHFTISHSFEGSVLFATRFSATHCIIESRADFNCLRFIDSEGKFIRFRIMSDSNIDKLHEEVYNEA